MQIGKRMKGRDESKKGRDESKKGRDESQERWRMAGTLESTF
jgi:hypothetical protein